MLPITVVVGFGHDDVVAQRNAEQLSGRGKLLGERGIFLAWRWIARGVIVGDDDTSRAVYDSIREDFPWMSQYRVECPDRNSALRNQPLATVERETHKVLLLLGPNVGKTRQDILHSPERFDVADQMTLGEFERGQNLACGHVADTVKRAERFEADRLGAFLELLLDLASNLRDIGARVAIADHDL